MLIYFSSRTKSKIDYFLFDETLEEYILNLNFSDEDIIGADHVPGRMLIKIPGLTHPIND